jgi:hypothetical protein
MSPLHELAGKATPSRDDAAQFLVSAASIALARTTPLPAPVTATRTPLAVFATNTPIMA